MNASPSHQFQHLFFTDNLEANFTLTVDPNSELPLGLGLLKATTLLRLVGSTNADVTIKYIGNTSFVVYEVDAPGRCRGTGGKERVEVTKALHGKGMSGDEWG